MEFVPMVTVEEVTFSKLASNCLEAVCKFETNFPVLTESESCSE
jgi:hypothetical protein